MTTTPTLLNPTSREDWEKAVKKHARRIRGMISGQVFGWNIKGNKDAEVVAIYLKGVEEGRKASEAVLAEILKKYQKEEKTQ